MDLKGLVADVKALYSEGSKPHDLAKAVEQGAEELAKLTKTVDDLTAKLDKANAVIQDLNAALAKVKGGKEAS